MKELQQQLEQLQQQADNIRTMMRNKLQPYCVNDDTYVNGDITVIINHGCEEGQWTMYSGKDWVESYFYDHPFELTLWNILHGIHEFVYATTESPE